MAGKALLCKIRAGQIHLMSHEFRRILTGIISLPFSSRFTRNESPSSDTRKQPMIFPSTLFFFRSCDLSFFTLTPSDMYGTTAPYNNKLPYACRGVLGRHCFIIIIRCGKRNNSSGLKIFRLTAAVLLRLQCIRHHPGFLFPDHLS